MPRKKSSAFGFAATPAQAAAGRAGGSSAASTGWIISDAKRVKNGKSPRWFCFVNDDRRVVQGCCEF